MQSLSQVFRVIYEKQRCRQLNYNQMLNAHLVSGVYTNKTSMVTHSI